MKYKIRSAEYADGTTIYNFICELEETVFDYRVFESIFKKNTTNKEYHYLVAIDNNNIVVGFISCHTQNLLHHCGNVAEIQELFVEENNRKSGIGKLLINALVDILQTESCVSLEVTAQNKRVQTHLFYEQAGFKNTHKKFVLPI